MAVNPVTNKIYVTNMGGQLGFSNTVTVIDGSTNSTASVTVGSSPVQVAVNSVTNKIYVSSSASDNITVIDGVTNITTTLSKPAQILRGPGSS